MKRIASVLLAALSVSCSGTPAPSAAPAVALSAPAAPAAKTPKAAVKAAAVGTVAPAAPKAALKPQPAPTTEQTQEQRSILSTETIL